MIETVLEAPPSPPADEEPFDHTVPLDEFCTDLSRTDRRVEMIAAFNYMERAAGNSHDTPTNYHTRYIAAQSIKA